MAHDVFISYASPDKRVADGACRAIEAGGLCCWMAPRDVRPGMSYTDAIAGAIEACRIMVLVFSSHSNADAHVHREVERATTHGLTVIPLRIESAVPARSLDNFLAGARWVDAVGPPLDAHLQTLAEVTASILRALRPLPPPPRTNFLGS